MDVHVCEIGYVIFRPDGQKAETFPATRKAGWPRTSCRAREVVSSTASTSGQGVFATCDLLEIPMRGFPFQIKSFDK